MNNETFLRLRNEIPAYLFKYVQQHPEVKDYKSFVEFKENFRLNLDAILPSLTQKALENVTDGLKPLPYRLRADLKQFFTARLARQLFGNSAFHEVINEDDPIVTEALRLLNGANPLVEAREKK